MKKAIIALAMVLCAVTLFAGTHTQTIVLVSVVEEVKPHFGLEAVYVENGYTTKSGNEVLIHSVDIGKDTHAELNVWQNLSRFSGEMVVRISVSELYYGNYHTKGLKLSAQGFDTEGRTSKVFVEGNTCTINLDYSGKTILDSVVAGISIDYEGNLNLPKGDYVSYVVLSYEAK